MTRLDYFERLYARSSDPWHLTDRSYERRKYDLTVACLPDREFRRAYEPGCSVGVLTGLLADRCDEVVASDPVLRALELAGERVPGATFMKGSLPGAWPDGTVDLIVLSEVLYYLSAPDRAATLAAARERLEPGGVLVSVHWRHPFAEAECDGDQVQREIDALVWLRRVVWHVEDDFTLAVHEHA